MHLWSVIVGVLGLCGTGMWVGYHSRQNRQYEPQWPWFLGLAALLPAWLVAFVSLLTPPSGQGVLVSLPAAVLVSSGAGLLGVVLTDTAVRRLCALGCAHRPVTYWLLGVAALFPAWCIAFINLLR